MRRLQNFNMSMEDQEKEEEKSNQEPWDTLPFVLRTRELRKITGGSLSTGWMRDEVAFILYAFVKWFKPELVIQTGHLWGKSAIIATEALYDGFLTGGATGLTIENEPQEGDKKAADFTAINSPRPALAPKFISIDPHPKNVPQAEAGIRYLKSLYGDSFEFHQMSSFDFFQTRTAQLQKDFHGTRILGIVDGDHSWAGCMADLTHLAKLGAQLIFVDDTLWLPHLGRAAREFARRENYNLLDLSLYNGIGVLWKDSYRVGPSKKPALPYTLQEIVYIIGGRRLIGLGREIQGLIRKVFGRR